MGGLPSRLPSYVAGVITVITRSQLEYPTVDVSFAYLSAINKLMYTRQATGHAHAQILDSFADLAIEANISGTDNKTYGRWINWANYYYQALDTGQATGDHYLRKYVNGTATFLATESVDLTAGDTFLFKLSILGSTLKGYRDNMTTPRITATDTSFASGKFGVDMFRKDTFDRITNAYWIWLRAPTSPSPKPIAYFEIPVIGSGTEEDPFRAQMPGEIVVDWSLNPLAKKKYDILKAKGFTDDEIAVLVPEVLTCKRNLLSLTHSSLIKTDRATGKPVEYTAIVRVFDQPDRDPALNPIPKCLDELRAMLGVKELTRDKAITRAKQIDPDLTDVDLLPIPPSRPDFKAVLRDYIAHRESLGVKRELTNDKLMERYLAEDKGWT
ncbi:MAG: hypothetical protein QXG66_05080 [Candidatus Bathyarchaeia archaeon]